MLENNNDEHPPVFGSWKRWYAFVLLFLILQISIYYFLTATFR